MSQPNKVFYRIHVHTSKGEREITASIVGTEAHGFVRVKDKDTDEEFTVHRHSLTNTVQTIRKKP